MKSLQELLQLSASYLQERSVEKPRRLAEDLIAAALKMKRIDLYMQYERPIEEGELAVVREWIKRCAKGEPLEYVTGELEFYHCKIQVNRDVLIPRPETEILVDLIVKKLKEKLGLTLWDVCTGSGCIGIALKKVCPTWKVVLSDLSEGALAVAKKNIELNQVDVATRKGDLLTPFGGERADVIVCNPPYISINEYRHLDHSVKEFEPEMALVGGERGSEFYERLAKEIEGKLNPGGIAFFEIGKDQGASVKELFVNGPWVAIEVWKDWSGHDRFFFLEKQ